MKSAEELFLQKYGNKITASESWVIRFAEEYADQFRGNKIKIIKPTKEICIHEWFEVSSGNFIQCKKCFIYGP